MTEDIHCGHCEDHPYRINDIKNLQAKQVLICQRQEKFESKLESTVELKYAVDSLTKTVESFDASVTKISEKLEKSLNTVDKKFVTKDRFGWVEKTVYAMAALVIIREIAKLGGAN